MAVLSAVCYGAALPLSRLAYDYGTNALTILTLRYLAIILLLGMWLRVTGTTFHMAPIVVGPIAISTCTSRCSESLTLSQLSVQLSIRL